jgi:3-phosphoglycerate kinase
LKEAKLKISNEFYPLTSRKPKLRRSTSQKIIKHYINLGVDPFIVADIMLYTIEIAQSYTNEKSINQESFYKSMLNSYEQAIVFCVEKGVIDDFKNRAELILIETTTQKWPNAYQFQTVAERYFYY